MSKRRSLSLLVIVALCVTTLLAVPATASSSDDPELDLITDTGPADAAEQPRLDRQGRGQYVVQYGGPILAAQTEALRRTGGKLLGYVPDFAYIVRMTPEQAAGAASLDGVVAVGPYLPDDKLAPDLEQQGIYRIRLARDADRAATLAELAQTGVTVIADDGKVIVVNSNLASLRSIAAVADVAWIENQQLRETHNEYGGGVIMGANTAHAAGYDGSTQTVAVADTGLGGGTAATAHADIPASRITSIFNWQAADSQSCYRVLGDGAQDPSSGHGTHVAVSAVGDGGPGGIAKGTAPAAKLVFQAIEDYVEFRSTCANTYANGYYLLGIPNDLRQLFQQAFNVGARIHSNSWGSNVNGAYTTDAVALDDFTWSNPTFLVTTSSGNAGRDNNRDGVVDSGSVGSPATAKNVLSVGASENDRNGDYRCQTGLGNGCPTSGNNTIFTYGQNWPAWFPVAPLFGDATARNAQQMAAFSSRGPTADGRIKPDVVAPGTWILSGFSDLYQQGYDTANNPRTRTFQGNGWGRPLSVLYKYNGGTSMSNPLVAGGAAVVRDYYQKAHSHQASAALTKASLINSAVDLLDENNDGVNDNAFPIPNIHEGWGRVDIAAAVRGTAQFVDTAPGLGTGGTATTSYSVPGDAPFKVSLAWTDYPSTSAAAVNLVNDLDLTVTSPSGTVYRGNVFSGGWSATGGAADRRNNVENVYLQTPQAGTWTVTVTGHNVPFGPQRYALVIDGTGSTPPNQPPVASFTESCVFLACSFTDTSTDSDGTVVSWAWTFGDGTTSSSRNPSKTFGVAGSYSVGLTVTDDDGASHSTSRTVVVSSQPPPNQPPVASFTEACTYLSCAFTDTSTDSDGTVVSWAWTFGDGTTSSSRNPSKTFGAAGSFSVGLTVTDDDGASHSTSRTVVVSSQPPPNQPPVASFAESCVFLACSFTDTSTDSDGTVVSWAWTFGDGSTSSVRNPSKTFGAAGSFSVGLTVTDDDGASHSTSRTVVVSSQPPPNQPPVASFTEACTYLSCSFADTSTDSDGTVVSWAWTFGDGTTSSLRNPSKTYGSAGSYLVWLTATDDDGASHATSRVVSVQAPPNQPPVAGFTQTCTNLSCSFTDTSTDSDGSVVSWAWTFGDGTTSSLRNPSKTYGSAGSYLVWLTATDNSGASASTSRTVTVTAPTGGMSLHVGDLDGTAVAGSRSWDAVVEIRVVSNTGSPVPGAVVSGEWRGGGAALCTTGSAGTCTVRITTTKSAMIWNVLGVSHPTMTYNPAANTDPDTDSDGTTIRLDRP